MKESFGPLIDVSTSVLLMLRLMSARVSTEYVLFLSIKIVNPLVNKYSNSSKLVTSLVLGPAIKLGKLF